MTKLFSIGNMKLGKDTMIFNMSPASTCIGLKHGFCKVGLKCYAMKAERLYPQVLPFRQRQEAFWKTVTPAMFIEALLSQKTKNIKYLRINEAGEFTSQDDITKLSSIAKILKDQYNIITYTYTSRYDLDFSKAQFVVNGSSHMQHNEFRYIPKGQTATVDAMCPGDCKACNLCKVSNNLVIGINQH